MDESLKLFMVLLGCIPKGRHTEQHDFFWHRKTIKDLVPEIIAFRPEAKGNIHIDAYRAVSNIDGYSVTVETNDLFSDRAEEKTPRLFFINLGGYKKNEFEEYHYKMIVAATDKGAAIKQAKQTVFYKHTGFKGAESHVDDKYGIDVDDLYEIKEMLTPAVKTKYKISLSASANSIEDEIYLGYFRLDKL